MRIETLDFPNMQNILIRRGDNDKVELTIDKQTGDITLYHSYREHIHSGTWYSQPLWVGQLLEDTLVEG